MISAVFKKLLKFLNLEISHKISELCFSFLKKKIRTSDNSARVPGAIGGRVSVAASSPPTLAGTATLQLASVLRLPAAGCHVGPNSAL